MRTLLLTLFLLSSLSLQAKVHHGVKLGGSVGAYDFRLNRFSGGHIGGNMIWDNDKWTFEINPRFGAYFKKGNFTPEAEERELYAFELPTYWSYKVYSHKKIGVRLGGGPYFLAGVEKTKSNSAYRLPSFENRFDVGLGAKATFDLKLRRIWIYFEAAYHESFIAEYREPSWSNMGWNFSVGLAF